MIFTGHLSQRVSRKLFAVFAFSYSSVVGVVGLFWVTSYFAPTPTPARMALHLLGRKLLAPVDRSYEEGESCQVYLKRRGYEYPVSLYVSPFLGEAKG